MRAEAAAGEQEPFSCEKKAVVASRGPPRKRQGGCIALRSWPALPPRPSQASPRYAGLSKSSPRSACASKEKKARNKRAPSRQPAGGVVVAAAPRQYHCGS